MAEARIQTLPLVTLYLSERCNSRCVTCDYWRHGRNDLSLETVTRLLPSLGRLGTEVVLLSGGEPLLNRQWERIATALRAQGLKLWLLTSGLSLAKHARRVVALFDAITVSLDGTCRETYATIRGLDAFDRVCQGIQAAVAAGARVSIRVTLQRANFREIPAFVELARRLSVRQISFLAVDVANQQAFARSATDLRQSDLALRPEELPELDARLQLLERQERGAFESGFIAESPAKLRRIRQYFAALCGVADFPVVRCNAPEFSTVLAADGRVHPCFFIPGPQRSVFDDDLGQVLNAPPMRELRDAIRSGARPECARCVCCMWRDPGERRGMGMDFHRLASVS
jgi:MoaA/NifB/PqqE/SkfB family radical SAM enzyme